MLKKLEPVFHTQEWEVYCISGVTNQLNKGRRKQIRIPCNKGQK